MKLIIGLGNPGKEYVNTRHNAGFMALDYLADKLGASFTKNNKFNAEIAESKLGQEKAILAKPLTFMNESGRAVRAICDFYKISPSDVLVIHDDKDITLGESKTQTNRTSAGHNGVESIIGHLGTQEFTRLRLGIKSPTDIMDTADFVLGKFTTEEKNILVEVIKKEIEKIF
ncbi:MAG: aminoacyl-tRNA hydrolase [Patescibacteria group bacterium]